MNSEDSKTSEHHKQSLNLEDEMNLKRSENCAALSDFSICYP